MPKNLLLREGKQMKSIIFVLAACAVLVGCATTGLMGTSPYHPANEKEKVEFDRANRNVYPDDVRKHMSEFKDTTIAWAGIIRESILTNEDGNVLVVLTIDHHYYDWILDFGTPFGTYWLSPRGEGLFKVRATYKSEADAIKFAAKGNMVIAYGTTAMVDSDGIIYVNATVIKTIRDSFNIDQLDYGRSETPF
jgi:hypothetical protein